MGKCSIAWCLFGLTLLGLALRWLGLPAGLPTVREPDLELTIGVELYRTPGGWELGGERVQLAEFYPRLLPRLISSWPSDVTGSEEPAQTPASPSSPETVLEVRRWVALLSAAAVPLTFLLARDFVRAPAALLAAALMATSLLSVLFAHQARPHAVTTTTTLLALIACVHAATRPSRTAWIAAGAACGLAVGTLHNGVAILPSLAVAAWIAGPTPRGAARNLALAALALVPLVLFSYPGSLRGLTPRLAGDGTTLDLSGHTVLLHFFDGGGLLVLWRSLAGFEPALGVAAAGTALAWIVLRRRAAPHRTPALAVVLAFALPYLLILGLYRDSRERFLSPLLPVLAIAAAWGLERLVGRRPQAQRAPLAFGVGGLLLLPGLASCLRLDLLHLRPHSTHALADWIAEHVEPQGARIAMPTRLDLPLDWCREGALPDDPECARRPRRVGMDFASLGELELYTRDPLPKLRQWRASHYVRLEHDRARSDAPSQAMHRWLEANARCLVVLPEPSVGVLGGGTASYQDNVLDRHELYLLRLWRAQVLGPRLGLWAVRDDADLAPAAAELDAEGQPDSAVAGGSPTSR